MHERLAGIRSARRVACFVLAGCALLPVFSLLGSETTLITQAAVVAMAALAATRPDHALLVFAALSPLAGPLGALLGSSQSLAEPLVLALLGGWLLGEAVRRVPDTDSTTSALTTPALLFAGAVAASCAVQLIVLQARADESSFVRQVLVFLSRGYFFDRRPFEAITAGALLVEGVALFVAVVTLARRDPSLGGKVARMAAAGAAGVAALNISRLLTASLRTGTFVKTLVHHVATIRVSSAFPDLNAAGSYLAMALLLAGGLAGYGWVAAVLLILGGLWLTGSRAAFASVPLTVVVMVGVSAWSGRRSPRTIVLGVASVILLVVAVARFSSGGSAPALMALSIRSEMAAASWRMLGTHPVFGVGVGRFYALSTAYSAPRLRQYFLRENAHDNFLQILAELGIAGLGLFSWLLIEVARQVKNALAPGRASPVLVGVAGGLVAFLLTCLFGHPLLIPEVAYAFWLVLGLAGGLAAESPRATAQVRVRRRWVSRPVLVGAAALVLIVSVPLRGRQMLAEADRGQAEVGLSDWQTDGEGRRFRWMADHAQFYVPSAAGTVKLPLRLEDAEGGLPANVEIYLEGRLASRIRLEGSAWHDVRFVMPQAKPGRQFWRIELRVSETAAAAGSDEAMPPRIQLGELELTRAKH